MKENKITGEIEEISGTSHIQSETDKMLVKSIQERFSKMKTWRENSCPGFLGNTEIETKSIDKETGKPGISTIQIQDGFDWVKRWRRDEELYSMRSQTNMIEGKLNPVASPVVFSNVQAIYAQFQDGNYTATYSSDNKLAERIAEFWQIDWEKKVNAHKKIYNPVCLETVKLGTAITHNCYVKKTREVDMMLTPDEIVKKYEDDEDLLEKIKNNPKAYITEKKEVVDYDDVYIEHVPLEEFYVDPDALNLNDISRDARDCIWQKSMSIQEFINTYKDNQDPYIIRSNVDKRKILAKSGDSTYDQEINQNIHESDTVTVIQYYNKYKDQFVILANNTVVRKGPLPYNHKKLPFSVYKFVPIKNSFYGIGVSTLLDNIQSRDEMYNMFNDYISYSNANRAGTYSDSTGKVKKQLKKLSENEGLVKAGEFIEIGAGDSFNYLPPIVDNGEIARRREELSVTAAKITQISPEINQIALNTPVRNNQMMQENSLIGVKMFVNEWSIGLSDAFSQLLHILKQYNTTSHKKTKDNVYESQSAYRKIKVEGYEIEEDRIKPQEGVFDYTLKPDVLDYFDDISVRIDVDGSRLASKALQAKQIENVMMLSAQMLSNPSLMQNRVMIELYKEYLEKSGMSLKLRSMFTDEDSDGSEQLAMYQNEKMLAGEEEPSLPGMGDNHLMVHVDALMKLIMQYMQEMTGDPNVASETFKKVQALQTHLAGDKTMQYQSDEVALEMAAGITSPQQPPMQDMQQPPQQEMPIGAI